MNAKGFSSWPTAQARDHRSPDQPDGKRQQRKAAQGWSQNLNDTVATWPTPMEGTPAQNGNSAAGNNDFSRRAEALAKAVTWGTPASSMQNYDENPQTYLARQSQAGINLGQQAQNWPTPSASQDTKGDTAQVTKREGKGKQIALAHRARAFSHPDQKTLPHGLPASKWRPASRLLLRSVTSHVKPATLRRWLRKGSWKKRRLNPLFVEWLMGWPPGHALCGCSATEFAHWQQDMRGALSALPTASAGWIWEPPQETSKPDQLSLF